MKTIDVKYAQGVQHVTINNGAYQYDHGITLQVHGISTGPVPDFHFGIDGSTKSISVTPTRTNGVVAAEIPDAVLMQHRQVWCYVYIESDGSGYTSFEIRIPIIARPKPADSSYTAEQIDSYNQLLAQLNAELETAKGFADTVEEVQESIADIESRVTTNEDGQKEADERLTTIEEDYAKREELPPVVHESGNSETAVMSQKAVSEALSSLEGQVVEIASGSSAPPIVLQASDGVIALDDASTRPVQALTSQIGYSAAGWTSIQAHSTGRNLMSKTSDDVAKITYTGSDGTLKTTYGYDIYLPAGDYKVVGAYNANATGNVYMTGFIVDSTYKVSKSSFALVNSSGGKKVDITLDDGERLILYNVSSASDGLDKTKTKFGMVNVGIYLDGADTTYTNYIGTTLTAEFPVTVYGGTFDWGTGTLTSTLDSSGSALATPQVYQLTPQLFNSHVGYNVIWSNCGTTQVHYIADTKTYIDARIAAIAASIINV